MKTSLLALAGGLKNPWRAFKDSQRTARAASVATTGTVALCGHLEDGNAVAPLNAISHIVHGDEAFRQFEPSVKYTLTGIFLNDGAMVSWAALHETFFGKAKESGNLTVSLAGGVLVSLAAYLTDYHLVPGRLKPGFEKHLMPRSLLLIYLVMALALGLADSRRFRRD